MATLSSISKERIWRREINGKATGRNVFFSVLPYLLFSHIRRLNITPFWKKNNPTTFPRELMALVQHF